MLLILYSALSTVRLPGVESERFVSPQDTVGREKADIIKYLRNTRDSLLGEIDSPLALRILGGPVTSRSGGEGLELIDDMGVTPTGMEILQQRYFRIQ